MPIAGCDATTAEGITDNCLYGDKGGVLAVLGATPANYDIRDKKKSLRDPGAVAIPGNEGREDRRRLTYRRPDLGEPDARPLPPPPLERDSPRGAGALRNVEDGAE